MTDKTDQAYPRNETEGVGSETFHYSAPGFTAQELAAIKLKVPNSGEEWLDEMILESRRLDYAGQAMIAIVANEDAVRAITDGASSDEGLRYLAGIAGFVADAMIAEMKKEQGK